MKRKVKEGFIIYKNQEIVEAIGRVSREKCIESERADYVINKCIDVLENEGGEIFIESGIFHYILK